ncbi:MAG: hypothetical protein LWY06_13280 [Firmicutes bacterium]|nr:hypothetical protein [Bacillota bacterium]
MCEKCFSGKIADLTDIILSNTTERDFPQWESPEDFVKALTEKIPVNDVLRHMGPVRNLSDLVRDMVSDMREQQARKTTGEGLEDLFPTSMELAEKYNRILKKLLVEPDTGLPFIYINRESPGSGFMEVSVPTKLEWVFSMQDDARKARLWVNEKNPNSGIAFLQTISAICTGIQNLLDLRELARNPNFIISEQALLRSDREEDSVSKLRRLSLQSLAPIVCALDYSFYPSDVFLHALSLVALMKIPAADRWRKYACQSQDFIELIVIYTMMLEKRGEFESAGYLLERIVLSNRQDERICFLMAKISSRLGKTDVAIEYIERALERNPERKIFHESRYNLMEDIPMPDPASAMECPDISGIIDIVSGEMSSEEETLFRLHTDMCHTCKRWLKIMEEIWRIQETDVNHHLQEK